MHLEHHLQTFIVGETKNLHQHFHHEVHRGFIVVVHDDEIGVWRAQAGALERARRGVMLWHGRSGKLKTATHPIWWFIRKGVILQQEKSPRIACEIS